MSTNKQGVRIFGITLGQSSQMGQSRINESSFLTDLMEPSFGPQRFQRRAPVNAEAGSTRITRRTQLLDSESGESRLFNFDQNDQPPLLNNKPQGDLTSPLAQGPVEPSLRPLWGPASGPSNPMADQAISTRRTAARMRASNDPGLVREINAARKRRRRIDPQPSNSNLEVAPTPPPQRPSRFDCPICYDSYAEGTTTKCGHLFCDDCLRRAVFAQGKCPICRKIINPRGLIRYSR